MKETTISKVRKMAKGFLPFYPFTFIGLLCRYGDFA